MYQVKHDRFLTRPLVATIGLANITIDSLQGAVGFIEQHGNPGLRWLNASKAVQEADENENLLDHATRALENALQTDGFMKRPSQLPEPR
jgi:hypothetical protein